MVWISATDFKQWAERLDLQNTLPAVVRRAIHGSGVPIKEIDFPAGDSVIYPGLDGYLIAAASTAFVPDGISAWEFGTSDDVRDKANSNYKKRTEKPQAFSRREATFVFVTPRRWAEKDRWCARKRAEGAWRDVKVIDADGLEQWLELVPSAAVWAAERARLPTEGLRGVEDEWASWALCFDFTVTEDLV